MQYFPSLAPIPPISEKRVAIRLSEKAERAIRKGHPWLFADGVTHESHTGRAGDLAILFDRKRKFLAVGLYDPDSPIRVKVLHSGRPLTVDGAWFAERIANAAAIRQPLKAEGTSGYRLIYGEGDQLPGLIVDRYADQLVLKLYSSAWLPHLQTILHLLKEETGATGAILRLSRLVAAQRPLYGLQDGSVLWGAPPAGPIRFEENHLQFAADIVRGHKTGFFFDHRENRARTGSLAAGQTVLDLFAYTGGFSLYAAAGGAQAVTSVDVSRPALEAAKANLALNHHLPSVADCRHRVIAADVFDALTRLRSEKERFGLIVVDPPSFAKRQQEEKGALQAYVKLVRQVLPLLESGGTLLFASCTSRVKADDFYEIVGSTAIKMGRPLEILSRHGHALDHPLRPAFPEGAYLKSLIARG